MRRVVGHIQGVLTEVLELRPLPTECLSWPFGSKDLPSACVLNSSRKLKLPSAQATQSLCPSLAVQQVVHILRQLSHGPNFRSSQSLSQTQASQNLKIIEQFPLHPLDFLSTSRGSTKGSTRTQQVNICLQKRPEPHGMTPSLPDERPQALWGTSKTLAFQTFRALQLSASSALTHWPPDRDSTRSYVQPCRQSQMRPITGASSFASLTPFAPS